MNENSRTRAEALRREAAWCIEQAKTAPTQERREGLITMAAKFHELAESTAAHDFNGFMQLITSEALGQRQTQQQKQQIQPEKKDD